MGQHTDINALARRALILDLLGRRLRGQDIRITTTTLLEHMAADWGEENLPTTKTLHRDLKALQQELGEDTLQFDHTANSYILTRPVGQEEVDLSFSASFLSDDQTAGYLFLVRQSLRQLQGTPLHTAAAGVFDALCGGMPVRTRERYELLANKILFQPAPPQKIDPIVWDNLLLSLHRDQSLMLRYTNAEGTESHREVDPLGLVVADQLWQLLAFDHKRKALRTFRVSRITSADLTGRKFTPPHGFDLESHMEGAVFGYQNEGDLHAIHLRFTREASAEGRDFHWASGEERWFDDEGCLNVRFQAGALFRITREVLAWSGKIEVLEPELLRYQIATAADAAAKLNHHRDE